MTDATTNKRLSVSTGGDAGPYIMVAVSQLEEVRSLLDDAKISYWVDADAISLDGKPEITVVNLARDADPDAVQKLLDGAP